MGKRIRRGLFIGCIWAGLCLALPAAADQVKVHIDGVEGEALKNVKRSLSIRQKVKPARTTREVKRQHRLAKAEIKQALEPYGYYHAKIRSQLTPLQRQGRWKADYQIRTGPQVQVTQAQVVVVGSGWQLPAIQNILKNQPLKPNQPLYQPDYKDTKADLKNAAYDAGFLDASYQQASIRINKRHNTAQITLVLDTGPRYFFGKTQLKQDFLDPDFAQKLIQIRQGDAYSSNRLVNTQLILADTDYFSRIQIDAQPSTAQKQSVLAPWLYSLLWPNMQWTAAQVPGVWQIPVTIYAEPSKPQAYRISGGYGTDTGFRVGFGVKFRHLNDRGHQLNINTRISEVEKTLHTRYDIPIRDVIRDRLSFDTALSSHDYGDITSHYLRFGIIRDTGWALGRHQVYVKLRYEQYDLNDGEGRREAHLLYPGYTWELRKLDDDFKTRFGGVVNFDIKGTNEAFGSNANFARAKLRGNLILPGPLRTRLLLRSEIGALEASRFENVPPSQRFFTGGSGTVRGYGYQKLSPKINGDRVGGQYLFNASVEGDIRFYGDFYFAVFYDAGNVDNSWDMDLKRGAGAGLHWASPIGMMRLDFAHPLDDDNTNLRVHFSLGPVF